MKLQFKQRALWVGLALFLSLLAMGGRLFYLQGVQGQSLSAEAGSQQRQELPVGDGRGLILDREGRPLHAPDSYLGIAVFPALAGQDPAARLRVADRLGTALGGEYREQMARLHPFWAAPRVSDEQAAFIDGLGLPGVQVVARQDRYGPSSVARHLVGYAWGEHREGLEAQWDEALQGPQPLLAVTVDGKGRALSGLGVQAVELTGKPAHDLVTTIDYDIQKAVEEVLDREKVTKGAVVVSDPKTGEILAMASRPNLGQSPPDGDFINRAVRAYPPGSVFKVVVAAAALEAKAVTLEEEFECTGSVEVAGHKFGEAKREGHGRLTFADAIAQSCNVTFMEVGANRLGGPALMDAARRFGFGQASHLGPPRADGIGGPLWGELPGQLSRMSTPGELAQVSFGQGSLTVTPLQMTAVMNAVANGGVQMPLRLIKEQRGPDGEAVWRPAGERPRRLMGEVTARQMQAALAGVTEPTGKGTGKAAWVEKWGSAGKTGTAEVGDNRTHAWFTGYVPEFKPRYTIVVLVEDGDSGGGVAAPVFREIAMAILGQK